MSFFSFFSPSKITDQLKNSSSKISTAITQIFTHKKLGEDLIENLEEVLLTSDVGIEATNMILENFRKKKFSKEVSESQVRDFLREEITNILLPCQKKMDVSNIDFAKSQTTQVFIFNGVNGAGKTTTIGKIAQTLVEQKKKVLIAAGDTFRAAAAAQLEVWAKRVGCDIIMPQKEGEDPASVAYRALDHARKNQFDILLIDTAGRLQNKQNLMDELRKISTVLKKIDASAPHENLLILDATIGQNAKSQLEVFNSIVGISGLIITKLDGTAKGGVVVALAEKFAKPIYAIGVGEKISDLQEFSAEEFAKNLLQ